MSAAVGTASGTLARTWADFLPELERAWRFAEAQVAAQPLLQMALGGMALVLAGGLLRGLSPVLGGLLRGLGNFGLICALLLTGARLAHIDTGIAFVDGVDDNLQVTGKETRVDLDADGHFWLRGTIDGVPARFLVDTGATITSLDPATARRARLEADRDADPIVLHTANGAIRAVRMTIPRLKIGNVAAKDLGAVVTPGMDGTNVLGMNFLSRLASWRVEGKTLILVPHHPVAAGAANSQ